MFPEPSGPRWQLCPAATCAPAYISRLGLYGLGFRVSSSNLRVNWFFGRKPSRKDPNPKLGAPRSGRNGFRKVQFVTGISKLSSPESLCARTVPGRVLTEAAAHIYIPQKRTRQSRFTLWTSFFIWVSTGRAPRP